MAVMPLSEAKLREWMHEMGPRLMTLSASICRDRHRAEEIVQEAFIKLWKNPPDAGDVVYPAWLRKVVTNLSINALQRTKRPGALPEFSEDPAMRVAEQPEDRTNTEEQVNRVTSAMDRLDESKRAILMLRANEQLSYEQIADHLGVPVGTVMSRLNRARQALLEEMNKGVRHVEDRPAVFEFKKYKHA